MNDPTAADWIFAALGAGAAIFGLIGMGYMIGKRRCEKHRGGPKNSKHW